METPQTVEFFPSTSSVRLRLLNLTAAIQPFSDLVRMGWWGGVILSFCLWYEDGVYPWLLRSNHLLPLFHYHRAPWWIVKRMGRAYCYDYSVSYRPVSLASPCYESILHSAGKSSMDGPGWMGKSSVRWPVLVCSFSLYSRLVLGSFFSACFPFCSSTSVWLG